MSERENMDLTPEEERIRESLRGLGEVRADEAFRARLRAQFVSGGLAADSGTESPTAADPAAPAPAPRVVALPARRRRWPLILVPAIAAALTVIFLGGGDPTWQLQDVQGTGSITINGQSADAGDRAAIAALVVPLARISVPEGVQIDLVLDGVMVVGVAGPADFTLPDAPKDKDPVYAATVHEGDFRIKTGPEFPGCEALLLTTEGRVEITGTTVAVFKNADVTCVCVLEGTAQIGRDDTHLDPVSGGMRKVMFADGRDPMIMPIEPDHARALQEFEDRNAGTFR